MPRGDDPTKQAVRLSQDLSANFKAISNQITAIQTSVNTAISAVFTDLTYTFNTTSGATVSLNHNLGVIPSGWYIIDSIGVFGVAVDRTSWDTVQLTLRGVSNLGGTSTVKVRVFI